MQLSQLVYMVRLDKIIYIFSILGKKLEVDVLLSRNKLQGYTIIAPSLACWRRAIIKQMPMMTSAPGTVIFSAWKNQLKIPFCL